MQVAYFFIFISLFLVRAQILYVSGQNEDSIFDGDGTGFTGIPQFIMKLPNLTQLSTARDHTVATDITGALYGFGRKTLNMGILSNTLYTRPGLLNCTLNISAAFGGRESTFLVNSTGSLFVIGDNTYGELGDGTNVDRLEPTLITTIDNFDSISNYRYHTMALLKNGSVATTGKSVKGELGDGGTTDRNYFFVIDISNIIQVSASYRFSYFLNNAGEVFSCGLNDVGQLGNGGTTDVSVPTKITLNHYITKVATGSVHAIFLTDEGLVLSTGSNLSGQTGNSTSGTGVFQYIPGLISGLMNITDVSAGEKHTIVLNVNQSAYSFGSSGNGELADGKHKSTNIPSFIDLKNVKNIYAGYYRSYFVTQNDEIYGAGKNSVRQLGYYGSFVKFRKMKDHLQQYSFKAFDSNSFGITSDARVIGIGSNANGQLGINSTDSSYTPTLMYGITDAVDVQASSSVTEVLTSSGDVFETGKLLFFKNIIPQHMISDVKKIAVAGSRVIVIKNDNTIYGWGRNLGGVLCNATSSSQIKTPGKIVTIQNISDVSLGGTFSLLLHQNGTAYGCGYNSNYEFTAAYLATLHTSPVFIVDNIQKISAGYSFSMFLHINGSLLTVGSNGKSQLGSPTTTNFLQVILHDIIDINGGSFCASAIDKNGKLYRWGDNGVFQSDDSEASTIPIPLMVDKDIFFTKIIRATSDSSAFYGYPTCNGLNYTDPLVCSGFGNCSTDGTGECFCNNGYLGSNCEISICNGINSNE
eukprot:gene11943-5344_t